MAKITRQVKKLTITTIIILTGLITITSFIEAGALLKKDFRMGNVAEMIDTTDPLFDRALSQFIFSKNKYMINGKSYSIQGYRSITNPSNSSWWFVEEIPKGFK